MTVCTPMAVSFGWYRSSARFCPPDGHSGTVGGGTARPGTFNSGTEATMDGLDAAAWPPTPATPATASATPTATISRRRARPARNRINRATPRHRVQRASFPHELCQLGGFFARFPA